MPGYFYAPPPARIGGSQPYAPRLGIVQSGPTPQAPPLQGPIALATLTVLIAAWRPPFVQAQGSADIAPILPTISASNPPPLVRQTHIAAAWTQEQPTVIYLTQIAAQSIVPDAPPVIQTALLQTILRSWIPPYIASQGYAELAPLIQAPVTPDAPPVGTRVVFRSIIEQWKEPWHGAPRPLPTAALPAAPVASQPPVKTYTVLHSIVQQWTTPLSKQQVYGVAALLPPVVVPDVIYEIVPYLIGQTEDSARFMLTQVYLVPVVIGSGGTVQAQSLDLGTLVPRGTTVTITMGGPENNGRRRRSRGQPPYNSGIA